MERLWVDHMTVRASAALIGAATPAVGVKAVGPRLVAPGGGLNILNGCDGTDMLFLLWAAILVAPLGWRARLWGLLGGTACVFALNLGRIVALFYAYRSDRALFDLLHTTVAPLLLVAIVGLGFQALLRSAPRHPDPV